MEWHSSETDKVLETLNSSKNGLSQKDAEARLAKYGLNELKEKKRISPFKIFISQFKSVLILVLIVATVISFLLGEMIDAIVIAVVVLLNSVLGFIQEYKAEKSIEALKKLGAVKAIVIRDGEKKVIPANQIVPGDIMIVEEGDKISADARIIESYNLATMESSLTGESEPNAKHSNRIREDTPIADRVNMIYSGTLVTRGRGIAVVTATGMDTEIGKVAKMIQEAEKEIPLIKQINKMGKLIGAIVVVICILLFALLALRGEPMLAGFITAIALAVAAVPESLPAIVTIGLAVGVQRMAKRNALIRHLPSVETLGSATVICTDKTGTLTMNEMTVRKIYANNQIIEVTGEGYSKEGKFSVKETKNIALLLKAGLLCNNASLSGKTIIGDPTEGALLVSAAKAGMEKSVEEKNYPRIDEIPFSSERKMMTTLHKHGGKKIAFAKGAVQVILPKCRKIMINGKIRLMGKTEREKILQAETQFANEALRVLAFAFKECTKKDDAEKDLVFLGLQGMKDPPRKEAREAIEKCKTAGIKVVMITGDQKITAEAIAKEIGLEGKAVTGEELDKMSDKEFYEQVNEITIYARVNPEHKIRIVNALKKQGQVVAMTGDGVNDAPALKEAHIGVAMGINGTEAAKEASDMVLLDDNFASIVNAVEEGRGIYDNIRKFTNFLLSANIAEVLIIFIAVLLAFPLPLLAVQILWLNLVTDSFPALALSIDDKARDIMLRKPRLSKEKIINKEMGITIMLIALAVTIAVLLLFVKYLPNVTLAQTVAFTALVCIELAVPFIVKARYDNKLFKNKWLIGAVLLSLALQMAVVYTGLGKFFSTTPLAPVTLAYIGIIILAILIIGITLSFALRKTEDNKSKINKL